MKIPKKWVLLLGTILVVVGAAVLPQQISQARDRGLFHQVNAETATDTLFSPVGDLATRIELLARWELENGAFTDVTDGNASLGTSQENLPQNISKAMDYSLMTHSDDLEQRALDALRALAAEVPPIAPLIPQEMPEIEGDRQSIFDWDTGEAAHFIQFRWFDQRGWTLFMTLDEAMEKVVSLRIFGPQPSAWGVDAQEAIIRGYLDYLGMSGETLHREMKDSSAVKVMDTGFYCHIYLGQNLFIIQPLMNLPDGSVGVDDVGTRKYEIIYWNGKPITKVVEIDDTGSMEKR
ncbi:MAG: hypothetical protein HFE98_04065 [Ruminiclostridium sp.]|nr:hypothetical protein [Ruminiclostridium sp.]